MYVQRENTREKFVKNAYTRRMSGGNVDDYKSGTFEYSRRTKEYFKN